MNSVASSMQKRYLRFEDVIIETRHSTLINFRTFNFNLIQALIDEFRIYYLNMDSGVSSRQKALSISVRLSKMSKVWRCHNETQDLNVIQAKASEIRINYLNMDSDGSSRQKSSLSFCSVCW